jgi:O-antigen/teichoic acid export membrane protein
MTSSTPETGSARKALGNLVGAGVAGVAGVAVTWAVARTLGPVHAGAFFAATAAFMLTSGVAKLGTQTGLVYWPARLRAQGRPHLLGACLRVGLTPVAIAALLLGVVLWIAAPALAGLSFRGPHLGSAAAIDGYADQVRVLAVFLPFAALSDSMLAATRGYRQMRPTVLLDRIARPALQLAGVGALLLAAGWVAVPAPAYALAWAVPYLPVAILAGYALRRAALAHQGPLWEARSTEPEGLGAAFWKFTWPRAVASVAQLALQRVDVLLVAGLGGLGAAAVYAVAGRFVVPGQFVNQAITQAVQPRLAEQLAVDDRAAANSLYQTATGWLVFATWPMYLLVICYAPVYLGLFGSGYRSGAPVVAVLACATLIATGCGMVDVVLSMAGRTTWNLGNVSLALAAMVAIDLTLIPHLGALGAAIGLATAVVVNNLLPLAQVGSALRLHPFGRGTLAAAGLAAGCFGLLPLAVAVLAGTGPSALLIAVVIATTAYLAGAHRLRRTLALDAFAAALRGRRGLRPGDGGRVRREGGSGRRLARQE